MSETHDAADSPDQPASVFISHASRDATRAGELCAALEAEGCPCWIAPRDIPPAMPWPDAITAGVKGSRALVVLLTARSMLSPHLLREVELAVASGKPVIPVRLDATPLAAGLQFFLSSVQWIDAGDDPPERQAAKVRSALERTPIIPPAPPRWLSLRPSGIVAAVAILVGIVAVLRSWNSTGSVEPPPPISLPAEVASLPFAELLQTVWAGAPPAGGATRPELSLEILAKRQDSDVLVAVRDGDPLRSAVDRYVLTARPTTPGHLYVVQIDSRGAIFWLFPKNATCDDSTGTNPVAPGRIEIPGDGRGLVLDDVAGDEHVYVVFANARWPELEKRLAEAARAAPAGRPLSGMLIASRSRGVAGTRPLSTDQSPVRIDGRDLAAPAAAALLHEASGSMLVIKRWFRHE